MRDSRLLNEESEDQDSDYELPSCRICFETHYPLIQLPCLCKGSLSYVHENCLNDFIHSREEREDEESGSRTSVICEICKGSMDVESSYHFKWQKLSTIKIEVYFICMGIICLAGFALHVAGILLDLLRSQSNELPDKLQYLAAYIWIICVIVYMVFEPIFSELKESRFRVKKSQIVNERKPSAKRRRKH